MILKMKNVELMLTKPINLTRHVRCINKFVDFVDIPISHERQWCSKYSNLEGLATIKDYTYRKNTDLETPSTSCTMLQKSNTNKHVVYLPTVDYICDIRLTLLPKEGVKNLTPHLAMLQPESYLGRKGLLLDFCVSEFDSDNIVFVFSSRKQFCLIYPLTIYFPTIDLSMFEIDIEFTYGYLNTLLRRYIQRQQ